MTPRGTFRQMWGYALGALAVLSVATFLFYARSLLFLFGAAVAMSAAARPVADGLVRKGLSRKRATAGAYLGAAFVVGSFILVTFGAALNEVGPAGGHILRRYELLVAQLSDGGRIAQMFASILPRPDASGIVSGFLRPSDVSATAFAATSVALEIVLSLLIVFMFSLYWGKQRGQATRFLLSLIPATHRASVRHVAEDIETSVGALILSEGLKSMAVSIILALLFHALGLPFPTFPALLIGLLRVVPLAGKSLGLVVAVIAAAPAGALQVVSAPIVTLAVFMLVDRVANRVLSCRDLNPLLGIFVALVFWGAIGWSGLLLAPPVSAVLQTAIESLLAMKRAGSPHVPLTLEEIAARKHALEQRVRDARFPIPRGTTALLGRLDDLMRAVQSPESSRDARAA